VKRKIAGLEKILKDKKGTSQIAKKKKKLARYNFEKTFLLSDINGSPSFHEKDIIWALSCKKDSTGKSYYGLVTEPLENEVLVNKEVPEDFIKSCCLPDKVDVMLQLLNGPVSSRKWVVCTVDGNFILRSKRNIHLGQNQVVPLYQYVVPDGTETTKISKIRATMIFRRKSKNSCLGSLRLKEGKPYVAQCKWAVVYDDVEDQQKNCGQYKEISESLLKGVCGNEGVVKMKMQACSLFHKDFINPSKGWWKQDSFKRKVHISSLNKYGKVGHPQIFNWNVENKHFSIEDNKIAIGGVAYQRETDKWYGIEYEFGQEYGTKVLVEHQWVLDNYTSGQILAIKEKSLTRKKFLHELPGAAHEHKKLDIEYLRSNPIIKYQQKGQNNCAFKSIASVLHFSGYVDAARQIDDHCAVFYADILLYTKHCGRIMQYIMQNCIRKKNSNFVEINKDYVCKQIGAEYDLLGNKLKKKDIAWVILHGSDKSCNHCVSISSEFIFDGTLPFTMPLCQKSLDECTGEGAAFKGVFFGYLLTYKYI